jgi:hypothetical protein
MRVILEKSDLIKVLENHFGEKFPPEMVQVRADPFEVELTGIPLVSSTPEGAPVPPVPPRRPASRPSSEGDGLDGKWDVSSPDAEGPDAEVIRLRAERNVSTEPPPFTADEMADDPGAISAQSRRLQEELDQGR